MDDFPGNSQRQKEAPTRPAPRPARDPKKITRVVEGTAKRRKQPLGKRIRETFTGDDSKGVWEYVLLDVLVPAAKDMMADATSQGVERLLFGEARSRSRRSRSSSGYTSYNRMSSSSSSSRPPWDDPRDDRRQMSRKARSNHDFDEIIIPARGEAEQTIDNMFELLSKYNVVTVSDLYELTGITGNYTDEKWGWTDLFGAGVTRVRDGYLLDLPRPEHLER